MRGERRSRLASFQEHRALNNGTVTAGVLAALIVAYMVVTWMTGITAIPTAAG